MPLRRNRLISSLETILTDYLILPEHSPTVIAAWILASWLHQVWDHFPHLAIISPAARCGKSTLMEILTYLVLNARLTTNISPAALYRAIEKYRPTLLIDEAQSLSRQGSEASQVLREMLNAGISRHLKSMRCGGKDKDQLVEFSAYCPKIIALIGEPDRVLSDRCLKIRMKRKTEDTNKRLRFRKMESLTTDIREQIKQWTEGVAQRATLVYDEMEPFDIPNDRMAELLIPLQTVLTLLEDTKGLSILKTYAEGLETEQQNIDSQQDGIRLLHACKEIFDTRPFLSTVELLKSLHRREEEPWKTYKRGKELSAEGLADLLRPYDIRSRRNAKQTHRGYHAFDFEDAWNRYLPK